MARTVGENMRRRREALGLSQEDVMRRMGYERQASVSKLESSTGFPEGDTIVRAAKALECQPKELLDGVETDYDRIRAGKPILAKVKPHAERRTAVTAKRTRRAS